MKKTITLLILLISIGSFAQTESTNKNTEDLTQLQIGSTHNDLQNLYNPSKKAYINQNDEAAMVWNFGAYTPGLTDLTIAYTFFNGTNWQVQELLEEAEGLSNPAITQWNNGEALIGEIEIDDSYSTLRYFTRPECGTGDWAIHNKATSINGITYKNNQISCSGTNLDIIHTLSYVEGEFNGLQGALIYNRFDEDGIITEDLLFDMISSDYYHGFSPDSYKLITKDNTVVILVSSLWHDMFYLRSDDNGNTWEKNVIWEHPYPMFNPETDNFTEILWAPDMSLDAKIDNMGQLHIAFGLTRLNGHEAGSELSIISTDAIIYWNEEIQEFSHPTDQHLALSYNNITMEQYAGHTPDINANGIIDTNAYFGEYSCTGVSTMPAIGIDNEDNVYVVWTSPYEQLQTNNGYNNRHLFMSMKNDDYSWDIICSLNDDFLYNWQEVINPIMLINSSQEFHVIAYHDLYSGFAFMNHHEYNETQIIDHQFNEVDDLPYILLTSIDDFDKSVFNMDQNYPNPVDDITYINIQSDITSNVTLSVRSIDGKEVICKDIALISGSNTVELNLTSLPSGIYTYSINGNTTISTTGKLIKR